MLGTSDATNGMAALLVVEARALMADGAFEEAAKRFHSVVTEDPEDPQNFRDLGKCYRALKRHPDASAAFQRFVTLRPADATGHHDYGRSLVSEKKYADAVKTLRRAIELQPQRVSVLLDLGKALNGLKRYQDAEVVLRAMVGLVPDAAEAHLELAIALNQRKAAAEARESCARAIALAPQNANAYRELGKAERQLKNHVKAAVAFAKFVQLKPKDAVGQHDLGRTLVQIGRYGDAEKVLRRAQALRPDRTGVNFDLGRSLMGQGRHEEALALVGAHVAHAPDDEAGHLALGRCLASMERPIEAIPHFERVLQIDPGHYDAMRDLVRVYRRGDRFEDALATIDRLLGMRPRDVAVLFDKARVLCAAGRHEDALPVFEAVSAIEPKRPSVHLERGRALAKLARLGEADAAFQRELEHHPGTRAVIIEVGKLYNREKRFEEAIVQFQSVLDDPKLGIEALQGIGVAQRRIGNTPQAIECFQKVLDLRPHHVGSLLQLAEMAHLRGDIDTVQECTTKIVALQPGHQNARLLRAQANFETGNVEASLEDLEALLAIAPDHPKATLYRDLARKQLSEDGGMRSISLCLLSAVDAEAFETLASYGTSLAEVLVPEGLADGLAGFEKLKVVPGGWQDCVRAAMSDWVMVCGSALPDAATLALYLKRASLKVGGVVEDPEHPARGAGLWMQAPLAAWLAADGFDSWGAAIGELAGKLRLRALRQTDGVVTLPPYQAPVPGEKPEMWLVSSSGMQLFGGVEQFLRNMVPIYRSLGYEPVIVGLLEKLDGVEPEGEVDGQKFCNILRTAEDVRRLALKRNPRIAQGTTGVGYELASGLEGLRTQVIYGSHFWRDMFIGDGSFENVDLNGRPRPEFARLCATIDQGYANSRYTQEMIEKHFGIVQPLVYSLPFDTEPDPDRPAGSYILLMNGRPDKGFNLAVEIAQRLPFAKFCVIAAQVSRERIEERVASLGLTNIEIIGWVKDTAELYRGARAVMVGSYAFIETFSRVVIEAHRYGVPIIGSNRGNVPLLLEESGVSLPEDIDAWTEEVSRLYLDEAYYDERCRLARENSERYRFADQPGRVEHLVRASTDRVAVAVGSGIGNMVQCSPVIRRIAEHIGRPVDVVMNQDFPGCGMLFAGAPWVGQVFESGAAISKLHFHTIFVLDCFGSMLPNFNADNIVITRRKFAFDLTRDMHESYFNLLCAQEMLDVPFDEEDAAKYFVGGFGRAEPKKGRIGLHAGGKSGVWMSKRWPFYEELVPRLQSLGFEVVSFGSKAEFIEGTVDLTGTPLRTSIQNLKTCEYFIANDSGIMHVADGLDVPLTSIFGPTSVLKNGPLGSGAQVLSVNKGCAPCQFDPDTFKTCKCISDMLLEPCEAYILDHMRSLGIVPPNGAWPTIDLSPRPGMPRVQRSDTRIVNATGHRPSTRAASA